jgi:hypothetical protein
MYHNRKIFLKAFVIVFSLIALSLGAYGQNIQVLMDAPSSVSASEEFQLNISINAKPSAFTPPNLNEFNVLMGPSVSSSSSVQIINGKMSQSSEYTYSYILQPKKTGKINLSPAQFTVDGKKFSSNSLTIDVSGSASQSSNSSNSSQSSGGGNQAVDESGDVFIKVFLDKNTAYQGEFIVATVKLYSKVNISSVSRLDYPTFDGFYKQDIETPPLRHLNQETVNGQVYGTGVIQKFILIPQKAGTLTISPCVMDLNIQVQTRSNSFFDDFFSSPYQTVQKKIKSKPVKVNIKSLPTRPASFTGAVGKFNFDAKYDKTKVTQNDPVILKLNISGAGNIKLIEAPQINFPEGIETSEPTTTNKTNDKDGGISGSKQFEYLLIPRAPGKITIPPIEFSYFDPVAQQYKTLTSLATTLDVAPGSGGGGLISSGTASKEDLQLLGKDIEYIKLNDINLKKSGSILFGSTVFYIAYLLPLLIFILILVWRRNYIRQSSNIALTKNKKAQKYAIKRLKKAKEYLAASKKESFYEEVLRAIWGYISDKLNIPVSELSRESAREQLLQSGVDEESISRVMNLLDTCEYAQYAPATSDNTMQSDYSEAISIITQIQEKIR